MHLQGYTLSKECQIQPAILELNSHLMKIFQNVAAKQLIVEIYQSVRLCFLGSLSTE